MDPDVTLNKIIKLARLLVEGKGAEHDAPELAQAVFDLDAWLTNSGFYPFRWAARQTRQKRKKVK